MKIIIHKKSFYILFVIFIIIFCGVKVSAVWSDPEDSPPSGSPGAPINAGVDSQYKSGDLTVGGVFLAYNQAIVGGELAVRSVFGAAEAAVSGAIKIGSSSAQFRGQINYISEINDFCGFDGADWLSFTGNSSCIFCGDTVCDGGEGENCNNCPADCGCDPGDECYNDGSGYDCCTPDCSCAANTCPGDICGDGCGGTCEGSKTCGDGWASGVYCHTDGNLYQDEYTGECSSGSCVTTRVIDQPCACGCSDGACDVCCTNRYQCPDRDGGANYCGIDPPEGQVRFVCDPQLGDWNAGSYPGCCGQVSTWSNCYYEPRLPPWPECPSGCCQNNPQVTSCNYVGCW